MEVQSDDGTYGQQVSFMNFDDHFEGEGLQLQSKKSENSKKFDSFSASSHCEENQIEVQRKCAVDFTIVHSQSEQQYQCQKNGSQSQPQFPSSSRLITKKQLRVNLNQSLHSTHQKLSHSKTAKTLRSLLSTKTTGTLEQQQTQLQGKKVQQISRNDRCTVWKVRPYDYDGYVVRKKFVGRSGATELDMLGVLSGHPFVVAVFDAYRVWHPDGLSVEIFMDYYPQGDLSRRIYIEGAINLSKVKIYAYQIFRSLNYIHSYGICHCNIKSQNFFLSGNNIVLGDFSYAKIVSKDKDKNKHLFVGSGEERAPELILGCGGGYDGKIDIWAAGCVIVEMILGRKLFRNSLSQSDLLIEIIRLRGSPTAQQFASLSPNHTNILSTWKLPTKLPQKPWSSILEQSSLDPNLSNLLDMLFKYNPQERYTAQQALAHPYFGQLRDQGQYKRLCGKYGLEEGRFFCFVDGELAQGYQGLIPSWYQQQQQKQGL